MRFLSDSGLLTVIVISNAQDRMRMNLIDLPLRRVLMFYKTFTKEELEEAFLKGRFALKSKWSIKQHLENGIQNYTPEAWEYVIQLAHQRGLSNEDIDKIIQEGEKRRVRNDTWRETLLQIGFVGVVIVVILFVILPILNISGKLGALASLVMLAVCVLFMWKRGW